MGFSPLANMKRRIPHGNRQSKRNSAITGVGIHHNAGVNAFTEATNPRREVSANYWITNEGDILPNIDEDFRAWTSGNASYPAGARADHRNITFEISNTPEGVRNGTWEISPAAMSAAIRLTADIYKRHNLGPVLRGANRGVGVHKDWVPTACPGPYFMANLRHFIADAEKIRSGEAPAPTPAPSPAPPKYSGKAENFVGHTIKIDRWWNYKTAADAKNLHNPITVMPAGEYKVTKVASGQPHLVKTDNKHSGWVNEAVLVGHPEPKPAPKPQPKPPAPSKPRITTTEGWYNYKTAQDARLLRNAQRVMPAGTYEITRTANGVPHLRNVNGKHSGWVHPSVLGTQPEPKKPTPSKKSVATIAREIVRGVNGKNPWGDEPQRTQRLRAAGYTNAEISQIQREVNKLV